MTTPAPVAAIIYLDIDDEITTAATRMRTLPERRLAIVLPGGSRVATSRINFRLLAREATTRDRELAIVTPEAATRALAASAGLPVYASVAEFEDALADDERADSAAPRGPGPTGGLGADGDAASPTGRTGSAGGDPTRGSGPGGAGVRAGGRTRDGYPGPASVAGAGAAGAVAPRSVAARSSTTDTVVLAAPGDGAERRGRRVSGRILAITSVLIVLLLVAGAGTWLFLPTADVTVDARVEAVGPMQLTVRADPLEVADDAEAGIVPAEVVTYDLGVSQDFTATGRKVSETKAGGTVTWTNCDPTRPYTIPTGTQVRTADRQAFVTSESLFLPVAILTGNPPAITCQSRDVAVEAADPGTAGNVDAGSITVVPSSYNSVVIRATNKEPTSGGTHTESKFVTQKDVDGAMTTLSRALREQFATQLADASAVPPGLTLFPTTKSMSSGDPTVAPDSLVGQAAPTFTLGLDATGTATAVDASRVEALAGQRIRGTVDPGHFLVKDSVDVKLGTPRVEGSAVLFPVTARAQEVTAPDAATIRRMVKGLSVDDARDRLRDYGDATIDVWPGWVTTITPYDFRLGVRVVSDVVTEPTSPDATSLPTGSPGASGAPSAGAPSAGASSAPSGPAAAPSST